MNKDKWIAISLGSIMVLSIFAIGGYVFYSINSSNNKANKVVSKTTSSSSGSSSLEVTDNSGLGGGLGNEAQSLGASTEKSTANSAQESKKQNFTEYEKYKAEKSALFGDVKPGTGNEVKINDKVSIYYKGYLTNGEIFDNQWPAKEGDKPKPYDFEVSSSSSVLPGLKQGIIGMKVGGTRRVIIPPAVGYGERGQGSIPPDSVLIMDVELLSVSPK